MTTSELTVRMEGHHNFYGELSATQIKTSTVLYDNVAEVSSNQPELRDSDKVPAQAQASTMVIDNHDSTGVND
jgi:hypothetical protein